MADTDTSSYILRYDFVTATPQYFTGSDWYEFSATPVTLPTLLDGKIWIGDSSNVATARTLSGGATVNNTGVVTLTNTSVTGQLLTGFSSTTGTVAATDTILQGIDKIVGNLAATTSTANAALPSASFTDTAVTSKLLTGYSSGAGTVASTDTILQGINKLNGNTAAKTNTTIHADANSNLTGDVQLISGTNVTLTQSGQGITIAATGGGGGGPLVQIAKTESTSNITTMSTSFVATSFMAKTLTGTSGNWLRITVSGIGIRLDVADTAFYTVLQDGASIGGANGGQEFFANAATQVNFPLSYQLWTQLTDSSSHVYDVGLKSATGSAIYFGSGDGTANVLTIEEYSTVG